MPKKPTDLHIPPNSAVCRLLCFCLHKTLLYTLNTSLQPAALNVQEVKLILSLNLKRYVVAGSINNIINMGDSHDTTTDTIAQ